MSGIGQAKAKSNKKDMLLGSGLVVLMAVVAGTTISVNSLNTSSIMLVLSEWTLLVLGVAGLVDICQHYNIPFLVPDFLLRRKQEEQEQALSAMMDYYYEHEQLFLQQYSKERINYFMSQIGLTQEEFDELKTEFTKMRCKALKSVEDAETQLKSIIRKDSQIIVDQKKVPPNRLVYREVDYFVNFADLMFIPECAKLIATWMGTLICARIDSKAYDKIVIPYDGNFLLGYYLSNSLGKPVVNMRQERGRIFSDQMWDGALEANDRVIVVHDVLVSGTRILASCNNLPGKYQVKGLFCLVVRSDKDGIRDVEARNIKVHSVLSIDDAGIARLREQC